MFEEHGKSLLGQAIDCCVKASNSCCDHMGIPNVDGYKVLAVDGYYTQFSQVWAKEIRGHNGALDAQASRLRNFYPRQPAKIFYVEAESFSPGLVKVLGSYLSCFLWVMVGKDQ